MYGNICLVGFFLLASVSCIHCQTSAAAFIKKDFSYVSLIGTYDESVPPLGYVENMKEILSKVHQGNASFQELNKFGSGLDLFFTYKFLQKTYEDELSKSVQSSNTPAVVITVPDYVDDGGITFKELTVYNFPVFKKAAKSNFVYNPMSSDSVYQMNAAYNSDNTFITGSFYVDASKYFFVYLLKSSNYSVTLRKDRKTEAAFIKRELVYDGEDAIHTYDSSYDNSSVIDKQFKESLTNKVIPYVLSVLSQRNFEDLKQKILKEESAFVNSYSKSILDVVVQSALEFIKSYTQANTNGDDTFNGTEIKSAVMDARSPKQFFHTIYNLALKGFTNYQSDPKFVYNNASVSDDGRLYRMSQGIEFTYPQDGDKQATVNFVFNDGRHDIPQQYKVKSITIITEYVGDLSAKAASVVRNKEIFFNKIGILVRIETYDGSPVFSYVVSHLGNDIARAIHNVIESSGRA